VIVGIRFSRVPVHVGAYAETQFRIFVNHLTIRRVFVETRSKELFILENLPKQSSTGRIVHPFSFPAFA